MNSFKRWEGICKKAEKEGKGFVKKDLREMIDNLPCNAEDAVPKIMDILLELVERLERFERMVKM